MTYSAKAIANYFLELGREQNSPITPMKLQKLLYYAQGWSLAITNKLLFDEQIEAWKWGPVVRSVYREFKEFGNSPITRLAEERQIRRENGQLKISGHEPRIEQEDPLELPFVKSLLDRVWEVYGQYSPIQLSNMTHEPGSPWDVVVKEYNGSPPKGTDIPPAEIRSYFSELAGAK